MKEMVGLRLTNMIISAGLVTKRSPELSSQGTRITPILEPTNHIRIPFSFYFYHQSFLEVVSILGAIE